MSNSKALTGVSRVSCCTLVHDLIRQPAGLVRNVSVPIYSSTEYGPAVGTQEERDALWGALDISPGTIALSDEFAAQNGLPRSQRFPWDESKGTYIIGAFHQMHCLVGPTFTQTHCTGDAI